MWRKNSAKSSPGALRTATASRPPPLPGGTAERAASRLRPRNQLSTGFRPARLQRSSLRLPGEPAPAPAEPTAPCRCLVWPPYQPCFPHELLDGRPVANVAVLRTVPLEWPVAVVLRAVDHGKPPTADDSCWTAFRTWPTFPKDHTVPGRAFAGSRYTNGLLCVSIVLSAQTCCCRPSCGAECSRYVSGW